MPELLATKYCSHKTVACFSWYVKTLDQLKRFCSMLGMVSHRPRICGRGSSFTLVLLGGIFFFASAVFSLHTKNIRRIPYREIHVHWRQDYNGKTISLSLALTVNCCWNNGILGQQDHGLCQVLSCIWKDKWWKVSSSRRSSLHNQPQTTRWTDVLEGYGCASMAFRRACSSRGRVVKASD